MHIQPVKEPAQHWSKPSITDREYCIVCVLVWEASLSSNQHSTILNDILFHMAERLPDLLHADFWMWLYLQGCCCCKFLWHESSKVQEFSSGFPLIIHTNSTWGCCWLSYRLSEGKLHVVHVKLQTCKVASDYWSLKEGNWGQWVWTASKSFLVGCGRSDSHIIEFKCWTSIYLSCMAQNCRSAACPGVSLSYLFWKIYHDGYLLIASTI
jgi:hypothetical protein